MERRPAGLVTAIGIFKLAKATLLVSVGVALLRELPRQVGLQAEHALQWLGMGASRSVIQQALERLWRLDVTAERRIAVFSLVYAAVFTVEGLGLVLERRWAEWLTVFVTGSFIPLEIYELGRRFGPGKLVALVVNVAIVLYLVRRRLEDRGN
jgi:uncharacterized membrane protein (DUF2068 family)